MIRNRGILVVIVAALFASACDQMAGYDRDIRKYTRQIESEKDPARLAAAYSHRGWAYADKARYSRFFKKSSSQEYEQWFAQAIADHDRAIEMDGRRAEFYYWRGRSYFDRGGLELPDEAKANGYFDRALADLDKAMKLDGSYGDAFDLAGVAHVSEKKYEQAIADFTSVMKLDAHLGALRLAETHCERGQMLHMEKNFDAAIADYEKSIDFDAKASGCECEPFNPLASLYFEKGQIDKSRDVLRRASRAGRWIDPELKKKIGSQR